MNNFDVTQQKKTPKRLFVALVTLVVIAAVGGITYAGFKLLSVQKTTTNVAQQEKKSQVAIPAPLINSRTNSLDVKTLVDTKETGDCVLTMKSNKKTYVFKNSTKDLKDNKAKAGAVPTYTGCLPWSISIPSIKKGSYELTAEFINQNGTIKSPQPTGVVIP